MSNTTKQTENSILKKADRETLEEVVRTLSVLADGKAPGLIEVPLSETLRQLVEASNRLTLSYKELHSFALDLSEGRLDTAPPSRRNYISGFLKELQSHLLELTWQAQQVAKGDYGQRVDFMGDFSDAFNTMVAKLSARETELREKIEEVTIANDQIETSRRMLTRVLGSLTDLVLVLRRGQILYANPAARMGMALGDKPEVIVPARPSGLLTQMLGIAGSPNPPDELELFESDVNRWYSVNHIPMDWEGEPAILLVASDVTYAKHKEIELEFIANMDVLTGVMNRRGGLAAFEHLLGDAENYPICVCFIDLDALKKVNDTFGHDIGDEYIINAVKAITARLREKDIVCRLGGDEIMLVFAKTAREHAEKAVLRIQRELKEKETELRTPYPMRFSYGLCEAESPGNITVSELLNEADNAMYKNKQAKRSGGPQQDFA